MKKEIAQQIARFLNEYNKLDKFFTLNDIIAEQDNYLYILDDNDILIGAVRLIKFDWYFGGIKHLTVNEKYRKKGYGVKLLKKAEHSAINRKIRVLQSTIRSKDIASIKCFEKCGFKRVNCFYNKRTKRNILIYQKVLSQCE